MKRKISETVIIFIFVLTVVITNAISTVMQIKATEDTAKALICVQLQGPQCPLLPQPKAP